MHEVNVEKGGVDFVVGLGVSWDGTVDEVAVFVGEQDITDFLTTSTIDDLVSEALSKLPDYEGHQGDGDED